MNPNNDPSPHPNTYPDTQADAAAFPAAPSTTEAFGAPAPPAAEELSAEQRLAELEAKHASVADAYLRAKAEAENTRRRAEDEMAKARKFALEAFAESLLPVRDSLEAAVAVPNATAEQYVVAALLKTLSAPLGLVFTARLFFTAVTLPKLLIMLTTSPLVRFSPAKTDTVWFTLGVGIAAIAASIVAFVSALV
jgi:hypothetical protein